MPQMINNSGYACEVASSAGRPATVSLDISDYLRAHGPCASMAASCGKVEFRPWSFSSWNLTGNGDLSTLAEEAETFRKKVARWASVADKAAELFGCDYFALGYHRQMEICKDDLFGLSILLRNLLQREMQSGATRSAEAVDQLSDLNRKIIYSIRSKESFDQRINVTPVIDDEWILPALRQEIPGLETDAASGTMPIIDYTALLRRKLLAIGYLIERAQSQAALVTVRLFPMARFYRDGFTYNIPEMMKNRLIPDEP